MTEKVVLWPVSIEDQISRLDNQISCSSDELRDLESDLENTPEDCPEYTELSSMIDNVQTFIDTCAEELEELLCQLNN
jgi:archaellum component FlaC